MLFYIPLFLLYELLTAHMIQAEHKKQRVRNKSAAARLANAALVCVTRSHLCSLMVRAGCTCRPKCFAFQLVMLLNQSTHQNIIS